MFRSKIFLPSTRISQSKPATGALSRLLKIAKSALYSRELATVLSTRLTEEGTAGVGHAATENASRRSIFIWEAGMT